MRIAVLNTHPIQYFAPLYRYLNGNAGLEVEALYFSDFSIKGAIDRDFGVNVRWDVDLTSGYPYRVIGGPTQGQPRGFWSVICPGVWHEIDAKRHDALWVHGHNYAGNMLAMLAARVKGIPIMMRGETHLGLPIAGWRKMLRSVVMRLLYSQCSRLLAIGSRNREFYRSLGVPDRKIFLVPYTVDNARFIKAADEARPQRPTIRARFGINATVPLILYASKFQRRKRPQDVVAAMAALAKKGIDAHLLMIGSGEMDAELREQCERLGTTNVSFGGFVNQSELPSVYAACDAFVLPSEIEPWGLIVNEVMCAGLPVVTTRETGCAPDLVKHGETGFLYDAGDVEALADALGTLATDADMRNAMGHAGRMLIERWSYAECRDGIVAATAAFKT